MNEVTRRKFLMYLGGTAAATVCSALMPFDLARANGGFNLSFTPVRLPHPLPIYITNKNFLATGIDQGQVLDPNDIPELANYTVVDDVIVPPEYERYVILEWGDRIFRNPDDYVGYNHDYTAYIPLKGKQEGLLWVNHEYVSYPFSELVSEIAPGPQRPSGNSFHAIVGFPLPNVVNREFLGECLYNCGGTVARIRRKDSGRFKVDEGDRRNRRIHGLSGLAVNQSRTDNYKDVVSWGPMPHQQGDENYLVGTGAAATDVFEKINADGLGNRIIGTAFNCSGATTPWGTVLSSEENFQASAPPSSFFVGVQEGVLPNGSQTEYVTGTTGFEFGLVGEKYGWMVEIDPRHPSKRAKKHTWLGRFRHENAVLRVSRHDPLVVYLGDDRRGGHVWKFVSQDKVRDPDEPRNSKLFEEGTIFVAKFNPDGTGKWIPLLLATPTDPNSPTVISQAQFDQEGVRDRNGLVKLPRRPGTPGDPGPGGFTSVDTTNEAAKLPFYQGKHLGDFYESQGALLCDCAVAANLVGGTPCGRPEDFEIHPRTKEVFMAMTDSVAGSDGYADARIFQVSKYTADVNADQPSGGLYKVIESSRDGAGRTFRWQRFVQGGEAGTRNGAGFANLDNMVFDVKGNVWGVTDMSTGNHNGITNGVTASLINISHSNKGTNTSGGLPGAPNLVGIFGNNWLFYIPTSGSEAGAVVPFAYGPTRCELTGPTFVGNTLIISVQHPGEDSPIGAQNDGPVTRDIEMLSVDGTLFTQKRTVPKGSRWPANFLNDGSSVPRPATIGIRPKLGRAPWDDD
jgi:uncharacterized protein